MEYRLLSSSEPPLVPELMIEYLAFDVRGLNVVVPHVHELGL